MEASTQLENWLAANRVVAQFESDGELPAELNAKWDFYREAQDSLSSLPAFVSPDAIVSRSAEIAKNVVVMPGAQILPNVFIEGPAFIGSNVIIGNSALIRPGSVLSRDSLIGNHCHCTASLLAPKVRVAHFCGVSRSILERNCYVSAFVLTATVRPDFESVGVIGSLDEVPVIKKGCVIGENTCIAPHVTISPGIHIEANCFIGSFVLVNENIAEGKRCRVEVSIKVDENPVEVRERTSKLNVTFNSNTDQA